MADDLLADEALLQRLPLPLAQLYRRALNAKNALSRHLTGFYFWEAGLKLLASVTIVEFARQGESDDVVQERLKNLSRPALGHWWEFARLLVPRLADRGVEPFGKLREMLLGKPRIDMPRAAGLDALLRQTFGGKEGQRASVQLAELFDRLVQFRNQTLGHGAGAQLPDATHHRLGRALVAGVAELWGRLDVLGGRQLVHIGEVRQVAGSWLVERFELVGENARRLESLSFPLEAGSRLPIAGRLYLEAGEVDGSTYGHAALYPLVLFDAESDEVLFLNTRRGRQRTEYLCYTSGRTADRPDLGPEQCELLARVLGMPVAEEQAHEWAANSRAEEPAPTERPDAEERTLGEFELVSELGRGGMGIVYRAWQPSLGRQVALKKLQMTGDAKAEARFGREINALGRVEHPNLVKIFTSGSEGDQWFYAMELIEGVPLSSVCERLQSQKASVSAVNLETWRDAITSCCTEARSGEKPLSDTALHSSLPGKAAGEEKTSGPVTQSETPLERRDYVRHIVTLLAQVAEAAHALHEAGILHRDIKPGNIMVTQVGADAVLMDLGLAQLADDVEGRLTRTRQFVGTLRYAGPQQVLAVGRLDRRADVYSLGATLWELLALRPLYGATDQMPTPQLMEKIQREEPERLRSKHPGLSRDLEAIVHKCLEKDPNRRYSTAHDLARDLDRFLDGKPVQARPVSGWERGWKWVKRHPALAAVYGLMMLVALLGMAGGGVAWLWQNAESARLEAEDAKESAEKARVLAEVASKRADKAREEANTNRNQAVAAQLNLTKALEGEKKALTAEALAKRQLQHINYVFQINMIGYEWYRGNFRRALQILQSCNEEQRGWEWKHLNLTVKPELYKIEGLDAADCAAAFSRDGSLLALAGSEKTIKIWDVFSGKELRILRSQESCRQLLFSDDGKHLASETSNGVMVWDLASAQAQFKANGHIHSFSPDGSRLATTRIDQGALSPKTVVWDGFEGKELFAFDWIQFSPDSRRFASGDHEKKGVNISDAASGKLLYTLDCFKVIFSPDGQRLASLEDNSVKLWDAATGKELFVFAGHTDQVQKVAFSLDGRLLASASYDKTVMLWNVADGKLLHTLKHAMAVTNVAFGPDARQLATTTRESAIIWDVPGGKEQYAVNAPDPIFSPDACWLAARTWERNAEVVKVWEASSGREVRTLRGEWGPRSHLVFSPDGRRLATASNGSNVKVWDVSNSKDVEVLLGHKGEVLQVDFSPDGQRLASAGGDKTVRMWDCARGQELFAVQAHTDFVRSVVFNADGKLLASASVDKTVKVWNAASGKELYMLADEQGFEHLLFSPDGRRLITASYEDGKGISWEFDSDHVLAHGAVSPDGLLVAVHNPTELSILDATNRRKLMTFKGPFDWVLRIAFSPNSQRVAVVMKDVVKVFDIATGDTLQTFKVAAAKTFRPVFSRDGQQLAIANVGGVIALLNVVNGNLQMLYGHIEELIDVAFSPDGQRLVSAGMDSMVKVWDATSGEELCTLEAGERAVWHVTFSPDGRRLAAACGDGAIRIWESNFDAERLEKRWQAWRDQQAKSSEQAGQFFMAAFHHLCLADTKAKAGLWGDADFHLAKAIQLDPAQRAAWQRRNLVLVQLNEQNKNSQLLEQALERYGKTDNPLINNEIAWMAAVQPWKGDIAQAVTLAEKAVKLSPDNPAFLTTLGAALYRTGRFEEALQHLTKAAAVPFGRNNPRTVLFLAMAEHRLGHVEQAKEWLQKAVQASDRSLALSWDQQLELRLLREQAETILNTRPAGKGGS